MKRIEKTIHIYPTLDTVVGTVTDGRVSWMNIVCVGMWGPEQMVISIGKLHCINKGLLENRTMSVNMVDESMLARVRRLETAAGEDENSLHIFDYFSGELSSAPLIAEAPLAMECRIADIIETDTHYNYIVTPVDTYAREDILTDIGEIDYDKYHPALSGMPAIKMNSDRGGKKMEAIFNRRSVRQYQDRAVEDEKLEKLLRAAMQAPSAGNQQSSEFLVVRDRDSLERLSGMSPYSKMIAKAPAAIVLLGSAKRMRYAENWEQDLGAAAENLLLEAVELGLGAVWLGVHPLEERVDYIRRQFSLPDDLRPFAVIALGYPQNENANHFEDRWDASRVHYEKIG